MQAGAYAEHDFATVSGAGQPLKVDGPYVQLRLEPGSGTKLRFGMKTFIRQPSFAWGWRKEGGK